MCGAWQTAAPSIPTPTFVAARIKQWMDVNRQWHSTQTNCPACGRVLVYHGRHRHNSCNSFVVLDCAVTRRAVLCDKNIAVVRPRWVHGQSDLVHGEGGGALTTNLSGQLLTAPVHPCSCPPATPPAAAQLHPGRAANAPGAASTSSSLARPPLPRGERTCPTLGCGCRLAAAAAGTAWPGSSSSGHGLQAQLAQAAAAAAAAA
jgi:hypothetical protein